MDEIKLIHKGSYPETLKNMKGVPRKLYARGDFPGPKDQKYLCIVGARQWTTYGRDAIHTIINGLKGYPISIVSGLAIGIDSIAHAAALEAGLHCIAFPGSSLGWDSIYPKAHKELAQRIVSAGGALVSRWPIGYPTDAWAFPARNTLMAGLSHATLIVEAAWRSGSLMTAEHAEKYDRDVFAIPGPINAPNSYGPHMLIKNGAVLVSSAEDVLEALGFQITRSRSPHEAMKHDRKRFESLDVLSSRIIDMLIREPSTIDALVEKTGCKLTEIYEKISLLEIEGLIKIEEGFAKLA